MKLLKTNKGTLTSVQKAKINLSGFVSQKAVLYDRTYVELQCFK